jgi:hypothetical protein
VHTSYEDILNKISEPPQWFDEHAVPRYCKFEPRHCADIHCSEAVLAEITCQVCGKAYRVAFSLGEWGAKQRNGRRLKDDIVERTLHYGDPPNACCSSGASTTSEPRHVLEYWHRNHQQYVDDRNRVTDASYHVWLRDHSLETDIQPDWVSRRP